MGNKLYQRSVDRLSQLNTLVIGNFMTWNSFMAHKIISSCCYHLTDYLNLQWCKRCKWRTDNARRAVIWWWWLEHIFLLKSKLRVVLSDFDHQVGPDLQNFTFSSRNPPIGRSRKLDSYCWDSLTLHNLFLRKLRTWSPVYEGFQFRWLKITEIYAFSSSR